MSTSDVTEKSSQQLLRRSETKEQLTKEDLDLVTQKTSELVVSTSVGDDQELAQSKHKGQTSDSTPGATPPETTLSGCSTPVSADRPHKGGTPTALTGPPCTQKLLSQKNGYPESTLSGPTQIAVSSGPSTTVRSGPKGSVPTPLGMPSKLKPHSLSRYQKNGYHGNTPCRLELRTSPPDSPEATASGPRTTGSGKKPRPDRIYYYAVELPFKCSNRNYRIIKVGKVHKQDSPGGRLYNISHGLNIQTSINDFKRNFGIRQLDNAAETIRKAKVCAKFLFVVACRRPDDNKDIGLGEKGLRELLGQPIADKFVHRYLNSIPYPGAFKTNCGPTEWVVCTATTAERVRQEFVPDKLDGNSGGDDDCWDSWFSLVKELKRILGIASVKFGCGDRTVQEDITL